MPGSAPRDAGPHDPFAEDTLLAQIAGLLGEEPGRSRPTTTCPTSAWTRSA